MNVTYYCCQRYDRPQFHILCSKYEPQWTVWECNESYLLVPGTWEHLL